MVTPPLFAPNPARPRRRQENRRSFFARLQGKLSANEYQLVSFAYDLAKYAHRTQYRKGRRRERYFEHPRAVALIAIDELGMLDGDLLCTLLLHDVVEDSAIFGTKYLPHAERWRVARWRIATIFGADVASMILGVTKPTVDHHAVQTDADAHNQYLRTLRRAAPKTLLAKMCDRLHNLRTLHGIPRTKQRKQADETRVELMPIFRRAATRYPRETEYLLGAMDRTLAGLGL